MLPGMLYQDLPRIDTSQLDGWGRWLPPALIVAAAVTAAFVLLLLAQPILALAVTVAGVVGAGLAFAKAPRAPVPSEPLMIGPDFSLIGSALGLSREPT